MLVFAFLVLSSSRASTASSPDRARRLNAARAAGRTRHLTPAVRL